MLAGTVVAIAIHVLLTALGVGAGLTDLQARDGHLSGRTF